MDPKAIFHIDRLKYLFSHYSKIPIPGRVLLSNGGLKPASVCPSQSFLNVIYNYRDPVQTKNVTLQKNFTFLGDKFAEVGFAEELSGEIFGQAINKQGNIKVVLKSKSSAKELVGAKPEQYIVVYDNNIPINVITVKKLNEQITILDNPNYASCHVSPDGRKLLCVVEINKSKAREESPASNSYDFDSMEYKQSWGEQLDTLFHTSLALFNIEPENENVLVIDKPNISLRDPFFYKPKRSPDNYGIGCVGWQEQPYKLGLIYCTNRPGCLLSVEVEPLKFDTVEPKVIYSANFKLSVSSPRVFYSPEEDVGCHVLFLERDIGGAHNKPARLLKMCMHELKVRVVMDNRMRRAFNADQASYSEIGPLFTDSLPRYCFTDDSKHIVFSSETPLATRPFILNVENGEMRSIPFPLADCEVQQVRSNWLVVAGSEPNLLPNIYIAQLNVNKLEELNWIPLEDPRSKVIDGLKFETFSFPSRDNPGMMVNCIWTEPELPERWIGATMFLPHGGPHSFLPASYYRSIAMYNELGFKTCLINYVGSSGVDHEYGDALLGHIGSSDVHDCIDTITYVLNVKKIDPSRMVLSGGSHGGFLVTHLAGQYPERNFMACIARNPVIDIPSLVATSDIPDWAVAESLGIPNLRPLQEYYATNLKNLETMRKVSPLDHVHKVKVPTLMMLGTKDLRVPMSQGLLYHKLLKARGVDTRCFVYDDVHSLAKINVEFDNFVNIGRFLCEQMQRVH